MTGKIKFIIMIMIHIYLWILLYDNISAETITEQDKNPFQLLSSARLSVDPYYTFNKDSDYRGTFSSSIEIDIISYHSFILSFSVEQILSYGDQGPRELNFHEIQYYLDYINLRKEFTPGILSLFWDHRCTNYINTDSTVGMITRWYGLGASWETKGMSTGNRIKRKGIKIFSSDCYINYSAAGRKSIGTESYPARWTSDFTLSFNLYFNSNTAMYISGSAEYFLSNEYSVNRSLECGLGFTANSFEISPYYKYEYITDNTGETPGAKQRHGVGIKAECLIDENSINWTDNRQTANFTVPSDFHADASYEYYIRDSKKLFRSGFLFALDIVKYRDTSLFTNASLVHSSPRENSGMYPAYIDLYYEIGVSLHIKNLFIEPLFRYYEYDEGNIIKAGTWNYNLSALRLRTSGMKPGFINSSIKPFGNNSFRFINNFEFELTTGFISGTGSIELLWGADSSIRWDIFGYDYYIIYFLFEEKYLYGSDGSSTLISETGIRFNNNLSLILFYRSEFNKTDKPVKDLSEVYHLAGIKIDI